MSAKAVWICLIVISLIVCQMALSQPSLEIEYLGEKKETQDMGGNDYVKTKGPVRYGNIIYEPVNNEEVEVHLYRGGGPQISGSYKILVDGKLQKTVQRGTTKIDNSRILVTYAKEVVSYWNGAPSFSVTDLRSELEFNPSGKCSSIDCVSETDSKLLVSVKNDLKMKLLKTSGIEQVAIQEIKDNIVEVDMTEKEAKYHVNGISGIGELIVKYPGGLAEISKEHSVTTLKDPENVDLSVQTGRDLLTQTDDSTFIDDTKVIEQYDRLDPSQTAVAALSVEKLSGLRLVSLGPFTFAREGDVPASTEIAELLDIDRAGDAINKYREQKGLKPLKVDRYLTEAAAAHAADLAKWDTISHYGPGDGSNPWDRVKRTGYIPERIAENVGTGQKSFDEVFEGWKRSPGHNKNLLLPNVDQIGMALVVSRDNKEMRTFYVQVFGRSLFKAD